MIAREYVAAGACTRSVLAIAGVSESTFYCRRAASVVGELHQRRWMSPAEFGQKNSSLP